jgi:hypothetical protein
VVDHAPEDRQIPPQLGLTAKADRPPHPAVPPAAYRTWPGVGLRRVQYQLTSADLIAEGVSAELLELWALRRVSSGRVAKLDDHYFDYSFAMPSYLTQTLDELTDAGLLTLAQQTSGLRRLSLTESGQARYAQLNGNRRRGRSSSSTRPLDAYGRASQES